LNFNKRLFRIDDEEGVSEVVGTILTLSITVVLFSSIFAGVQYLETPEGTTFSEFTASSEGEHNITVEHTGGKDLDTYKTSLFISFDETSHKFDFDSDKVTLMGEDPSEWKTGEKVELNISGLNPKQDFVELLVMDTRKSQIIWRTEVEIYSPVEGPGIKDYGVIYPQDWDESVEAGESCKLFVDVDYPWKKIDQDKVNVFVNLNKLKGYEGWIELPHDSGYRFSKKIDIDANQKNKSYLLEIAVNNAGSNDIINDEFINNGKKNQTVEWSKSEYIGLNVGPHTDITEQPNIVVDPSKINFIPASPTNGDSFTTRAVIENRGGSYAEFDVYFNDTGVHGETKKQGKLHGRIAAGGGQDFIATWPIKESGRHNISVEVTNITSPGGEDLRTTDNNATKEVYVAPTILLVDDDHEKDGDATKMKGALEGSDFTYEYYEVKGLQGPPEDKMNKFDIVIWMTGRTEGADVDNPVLRQPTLTDDDVDNIKDYLENENMFWLIGEGISNDGINTGFLGVNGFDDSDMYPKVTTENNGRINGTNILSNTSYPIKKGDHDGDEISGLQSGAKEMILNNNDDTIIGSSYEYKSDDYDYKTAFNSFQFSSIRAGHSKMAYRVIKWLGNMSEKSGHDLAVSDQEFSTRAPMFKDTVNITATIRNNGQFNETNAEVRLYVDGELDTSQIKQVTVPKGGYKEDEFKEVNFTWTADSVGEHELLVRVDPFDKIDETNELNNDILYQDYDATISVQFSILVVDDDGSKKTNTYQNTTNDVVDQLNKLGYKDKYDYVLSNSSELDTLYMSEYNSVFWVTGNNIGNNIKLNSIDMINQVKTYLDDYDDVSFFLEGNNILHELREESNDKELIRTFLKDYLGIKNRTVPIQQNFQFLKGVKNDNLTHGMDYLMDGSSYRNMSVTDNGAEPIFKNGEKTVGTKFDNQDKAFKTVTLGFDLSNIEGPNVHEDWYGDFNKDVNMSAGPAREEFVYMLTKWFGNEDDRSELRISDVDINVEVKNPMLGKSYRMTATIQNVGYKGSSALVRFMDGDSLIASESIFVDGDSTHTVEINWEPLFAGYNNSETNINSERNITILVDPLCEEDEIGGHTGDDDMNFNNVDVKKVPVFYFWDDMESGTENWNHQTTLANINGESPIGYLGSGYKNVDTNIVDRWDQSRSKGINATNYTSHTDPTSYWLTEPKARNETKVESKPIDVVFALDTSGSMNWDDEGNNVGADNPNSRMYQAVDAAVNFINNMTSKDRLEIWTFDPQGGYNPDPYLYKELAYMTNGSGGTPDNKTEFIEALKDIREGEGEWPNGPNGNTPYYDTLGNAIYSATQINDNEENDRLEFVIGLADGEDNTGNEYSPNQEWGNGGLLNAPPMVYNIGVVGDALHPDDSTYPEAPYWDNSWEDYPDDQIEEEMFHVGNSTPTWDKYGKREDDAEYGPTEKGDNFTGRYYFAEQADDIGTVFEEVRNIITKISEEQAQEGNVTSVGSLKHNSLKATENVFSDDFESNDWSSPGYSGSWQRSSGTYIESWGPLEGSYSAELYGGAYGGGNDHASIYHNIDLSSISGTINSVTLSFWETRYNAEPQDDFHIYVNDNDVTGSPFTDDGSHSPEVIEITNLATSAGDSFELKFEMNVNHDEIWLLDDIEVTVDYTPGGGGGDPYIVYTSPSNNKEDVSIGEEISVVFSKAMNTGSIDYTCSPNPDGWTDSWDNNNQVLTISHNDFQYETTYTFEIINGEDTEGNPIDYDQGSQNPWTFTTVSESGAGGDDGGNIAYGKNYNKTLVTERLNLKNYSSAQLTFWHKYKIVPGTNGGFLQIGYKGDDTIDNDPNDYDWKYIVPTRGSYTGNMNMSVDRYDDFNKQNSIDYAWNGVSGGGTFNWDYVQVNLLSYIPSEYRNNVKIKFNYTQYGGGSGHGWYIDDVKVVGSRIMGSEVNNDEMRDVWQQVRTPNAYGEYTTAWWNGINYNTTTEKIKRGIDNSLVSTPIDLTRANTAFLNADFKFNINKSAGRPPDGFRVEISTDNGINWMPINDGVRSSMGVSGSDTDDDKDGKTDSGISINDSNWVTAGSLSRLNVDLSGFSGETILIKFRMVTNDIENPLNYKHYDKDVGFRGFFIDNVMVTGKSLQG